MRRPVVAAVACCLALTAQSCKKQAPEQLQTSAATTGPSLLTERGLHQGMASLGLRIGAHPKLLEVVVYPDHIVVQAQDPKHLDQVLQYEYRTGDVAPPQRVALEGTGTLDDNLFSLDDIKLDVIPDLAKRAAEKVDDKNGKVSSVLLKRNLPYEMDVQYRVFVKSPIKDGYVDADKNGKLLEQ